MLQICYVLQNVLQSCPRCRGLVTVDPGMIRQLQRLLIESFKALPENEGLRYEIDQMLHSVDYLGDQVQGANVE